MAGPLDVILVRPEDYTAFALSRGVSILADPGASVDRSIANGHAHADWTVVAKDFVGGSK